MKKKKLLSLALVLVMALALVPTAAWAADAQQTKWKVETVSYGKYASWQYEHADDPMLVRLDKEGEDKYGFIDKTGKEIVPCQYDYATPFIEDLACVVTVTGEDVEGNSIYQYGFIEKTGKEVISCNGYTAVGHWWNGAGWFSDGLATVESGGKWGFIDKTGREVIPCQYNDSLDFNHGLAAVCIEGDRHWTNEGSKWILIDKTGKKVRDWDYSLATDVIDVTAMPSFTFHDGLAKVRRDYKWGFIDTTGQEVVPCQYDSASDFYAGFADVRKDGKAGIIDTTGKEVIPCQYDSASSFFEGLAAVELEDKWGFIDATGNQAVPCKYGYAGSFSEGLAAVALDGKYGFIDTTGNQVVPCKYEYAEPFSEGLARVASGEYPDVKYGFIDKTGQEVISCQYDAAGDSFFEGLVAVELEEKWGFIDTTGKEIIPCRYDIAHSIYYDYPCFVDGLACVSLNEKLGLIDRTGKEVVPFQYDELYDREEGVWEYSTNSDSGLLLITEDTETPVKPDKPTTPTKPSTPSTPSKPAEPTTPTQPEDPPVEPEDPAVPASEKFTDVEKDSWYEAGVSFVTDKGLFQGVSKGVFAPQNNMTRAMLMTVLARLDGQDTAGGETWYSKAMAWAKTQGISDGTQPNANVTREQMVTMLYRYAKAPEGSAALDGFTDGGAVSSWARAAVEWAVSCGILSGKGGGRLDPQGTATRAEVATIIQRFVENQGQ